MDTHTETVIQMVADQIDAESYGPWQVQHGNDVETHVMLGTFERAFDAVQVARITAAQSPKDCFILDRDGVVVMSYTGRA